MEKGSNALKMCNGYFYYTVSQPEILHVKWCNAQSNIFLNEQFSMS